MPSQKAQTDVPASKLRKRHRGCDLVPHDWDGDGSDVTHKKARRDKVGDEEHQTGAENLSAALEGEDVRQDKQQQEAPVSPVDNVNDTVFIVQRLCTGIDRQLHALNGNLSNPESTLIIALSNAATTAVRQPLVDPPVKKLQQDMYQCKQLLVRKQQNFEDLHRSSQQEQREQADALRREQTKVAGLSKQLKDERNKLAKVSASLLAEQSKCADVQIQLEDARDEVCEERNNASGASLRLQFSRDDRDQLSRQIQDQENKLTDVSASLQAERVMCTELSDAIREEKEKCSNFARALAAEQRKNSKTKEWSISTLMNNLSKISIQRSHPKESDSYSKLHVISTIAEPLFTQMGTDFLDFFLRYSRPGVIYCFIHTVDRVNGNDDEPSPPFKHGTVLSSSCG